ncbi:hypothetical protein ACOMHN_050874 [Nucella lapillus]
MSPMEAERTARSRLASAVETEARSNQGPSGLHTNYPPEQQWRSLRADQDQQQKQFYEELCSFPNLFSLRSDLGDHEKITALLRKQEEELKEDWFPYHLEKVRCHNLVIFCKFLLGRKRDALKYCRDVEADMSKSIIFLTLKAWLQFEFSHHQECNATMDVLRDMYKLPDWEYLRAVAESEKGYLLICIGPTGFLGAVDLFQKAIAACPNAEVYLWKYDLALAIRRNFSLFAYSAHSVLSPSELAERALTLLTDIVDHGLNQAYKPRAMVELARLVSHLKQFSAVCEDSQRGKIRRLYGNMDENDYFEQALKTTAGQEDFFVLRECGRQFQYQRKFERALSCIEASYQKRESDMVCQVLGKTFMTMYKANECHISPWIMKEVPGMHQNLTCASDSASPHAHGDSQSPALQTAQVRGSFRCSL